MSMTPPVRHIHRLRHRTRLHLTMNGLILGLVIGMVALVFALMLVGIASAQGGGEHCALYQT